MKTKKGFTLIEALIFMIIVSVCIGVLSFMVGSIAQGTVKASTLSIANSLAEGRMDYIQGLPFSSVSSVASTSFGGAYAQFNYQVVVEYVTGPSDLDTVVGGPTNYKKVTVRIIQSQGLIDNIELRCIKAQRT